MANRRGRPPVDDQAALRRVAEYLVDMEERGSRCSVRAAISRTSGQVAGNSRDADLWQRKWRGEGKALLAAARERKMSARRAPVYGSLDCASELVRQTLADARFAGEMLQHQEALRRVFKHEEALRQAFRPLEELRRVLEDQDALRRFLGGR